MKKRSILIFAIIVIGLLLGSGLLWAIFGGGSIITSSGMVIGLKSSSGRNHWNESYSKLDGYRQRNISLSKGSHTFSIEIVTNSGEISLSITGKDGIEYYKGTSLPTSTFEVEADVNDKITLRVDAKNHNGSYKIKWE